MPYGISGFFYITRFPRQNRDQQVKLKFKYGHFKFPTAGQDRS